MRKVNNADVFERMPVAKAVRTMAVPTIIGQLIVLIYNIADTFFIGRTNNPCMVAGASLILPVFNISLSIAAIAGVGGGALISRLLGRGRADEARRVCSFCVYLSLIASALFSLFVLAFMKPLTRLLGAGAETEGYAAGYAFCVIVLGGVPTIMSNVFSNLVRSVGESAKAGFGVTMGGVINILLDPVFMFVLLPKGQEIIGAGIATCLSNCISCAYFILVIRKLRRAGVLGMTSPKNLPQRSSILAVFAIGMPAAISTLLFDLDYIVIDRLMSSYSDAALAAIGIVLKAERLPLNIGVGICQAMVPIVAYNYAAKNYRRMNEVSDYSLRLGVICGVLSIALYEIFAPQILRFFISDAETVALGTKFLRARTIATLFMFMCFYHVHLFNGYGVGRQALFLGVLRWAVVNIPMLFLLNRLFGMYGVVWSQLVSDVIVAAISVRLHRRYLRENGLLRNPS